MAAMEGEWEASQRALAEFARLLPRDTSTVVEYMPEYHTRLLLLLHGPGDRLAEAARLVLAGEADIGLLSQIRFSASGLTATARVAWRLRRRAEPGDRELAEELAEVLLGLLAREDWPASPMGELARHASRGFLEEDPERALAHWGRALPLAARTKGAARSECLYGAFWAAHGAGEAERARELLEQTEALLAELDVHVVRQEVAQMREVLPADPVPKAAAALPAGLTRRELEVLVQVAEGLSNREVGESLFISAKTVSVHLSNLMGKLGVGNRTAAVARARELGLV